MPKKTEEAKKPQQSVEDPAIKLCEEYESAFKAMSTIHDEFDEKERIFMGDLSDRISQNEAASRIYDPTLQTAILKQNNDVCAQLPTGQVKAISSKVEHIGRLMNLILSNYIIPNANTQYDVFTKFWILSLMRKIYGSFGVLVDYTVSKRYIGPDFTLIPARSLIPQEGRFSIESSDYVFVRSKVSKQWLQSRDTKVWKNIDDVLAHKNNSTGHATATQEKNNQIDGKDEYELVTKYMGDKWITFSPDAKKIVREIENPQGNDELPVVMCHAFPLMDRFFGLGEVERGRTLHLAQNSLINLFMDGMKMSIFPPVVMDLTKVVPSSIERSPGARWIVKQGQMNAVKQLDVSPTGLSEFQSTYGFLKGSILSLTNTTDTAVSQSVDVGMGKTPQALKLQEAINGSRINFDRKMLETTIEKVYDRMIDLLSRRQPTNIKFELFDDEARAMVKQFPKLIEERFGGAEAIIKSSLIKNHKYKFSVDASSTMKKSDAIENESLASILSLVIKLPDATKQVAETGKITIGNTVVDFGELIKRIVITSGTSDWDKIITTVEEQSGTNFEEGEAKRKLSEIGQSIKDPAISQLLAELTGGLPQGGQNEQVSGDGNSNIV